MQMAAEVEMQKQHLDAAEVQEDSVRTGGLDRAGVGRSWRRKQSSIFVAGYGERWRRNRQNSIS